MFEPSYFGFDETGLDDARAAVVKAIQAGTAEELQAAWTQYETLATARVDALSDDRRPRAQIGLIRAKAQIWGDAEDDVRYWQEMVLAEVYAERLGLNDFVVFSLNARALAYTLHDGGANQAMGKYWLEIQENEDATRCFEAALSDYVAKEQLRMTDRDRGLLNLHMAECYDGLLQITPDDPELTEHRDVSLATALEALDGEPEQARALRLLDEYEAR
jgi:hypothetical protein